MKANAWLSAARPLFIAHRGASLALPENTLAAFALAAKQGADGVELDVQLSSDGAIAIIHDADLERLAGSPQKVAALSAADLRRQDVGDGQTIPLLPQLFEMLGDTILYNIELKYFGLADRGLTQKVIACVRAFGLEALTLISSFNPLLVRQAQRLAAPETAVALLRARGLARHTDLLVRTAVDNPHHSLISAQSMAAAIQRDRRVYAWTVDDVQVAERLLAWGVHGLISNDAAALRARLA